MKTIWKYKIKAITTQEIEMPKGAKILSVQTQFGEPQLWAEVDPEKTTETYTFKMYGTGENLPDIEMTYIGTFQINEGDYVFHLYLKN